MLQKIRKLYCLGPRGWYRLIEAYLLVWIVNAKLRRMGFKRLCRSLQDRWSIADAKLTVAQLQMAEQIRLLAGVACRYHRIHAECLHRSLVTYWMLRRRNMPINLCIGYNKEGGFSAHAWIEADGRALCEASNVQREYSLLLTV